MKNQKINRRNIVGSGHMFNNYFAKLDRNSYINNESPICVWNLGPILFTLYADIKKNYEESLINLISSQLKVKSQNCRAFYYWINNENPIPINTLYEYVKLWGQICNKSKSEKEEIIEKAFGESTFFSVKRGKKVNLPKCITKELAYLLGFLNGDGYIIDPIKEMNSTGDYEFKISITDNTDYVLKNNISEYFEKIFNVVGNIYKIKNKNAYEYYLQSKILHIFLNKVCDLPVGKKRGKLRIPKIIVESNEEIKAYYLGGLFDSDGFVTVNKKVGFGLGIRNERFLKQIKDLFRDLNISTRAITKLGGKILKGWELSISWKSLQTFLNKIPSFNPKKARRLQLLEQELQNGTAYKKI